MTNKGFKAKNKELKEAVERYKSLSKKERNRTTGKELLKQIKALSVEIHKMKNSDDVSVIAQTIDIESEMKEIKRPKYISIPISEKKNVKVMTPKDIITFKYDEGDFMIYGDSRCVPRFTLDVLKDYFERNLVLVLFRKTGKKKDNKQFAIPIHLDEILKSRKHRLAVAMCLPDEKEIDWMRDELDQYDDELSEDELQELFLSSLNDDIIVKDIKRIIQLYYQQTR